MLIKGKRGGTMKKIYLLIIAIAIGYFVTGCSTKTASIKTPASKPTKKETAAASETALRFDFPSDYKNWNHGVSKIILDKSSPLYGFQQVFVNDKALNPYKSGGGYPDGSMLIIGFYEPIVDGDNIQQGDIIWYAAMKKDSKAVKTAGWIFDGFDGKTLKSKIDDPVTGCYICHMGQKDREHVFTSFAGEISSPGDLKAAPNSFAFPKDLRSWHHSNSKVILDKDSPLYGLQQIYVNKTGFAANKHGETYPNGSHLTIGFYEPIKDGDTIEQGDIIWYASMKKDSSATKTGGWIMDGFDGKTLNSTVDNPAVGCFVCHMSQKNNDYVFSKYVP